MALFYWASNRLLGDTELAMRSLNLFTDEFFAKLDPSFFIRLKALSGSVNRLGLFGLAGSVISASFLFANLISTINTIFRTKTRRSFFYNRVLEYLLMLIIGTLTVLSLAVTAVSAGVGQALKSSEVFRTYLNPQAVDIIRNFFVQSLLPYALTFFVFFLLYKYIPEVRVHTRAALLPAAVAALLFEAFKRLFAFYVLHFSAIGIVMSKLLQGTLTSIIFFLLWITFSLVIMLWGAELAAVLNEKLEAAKGEG